MIDISSETMRPLSNIARTVPNKRGGIGINVCTVWRWATDGVRGHVLETVLIGGTRFSSDEALRRFLANINGVPALPPTNRNRQAAIAAAEQELAKAGF